MNRSGPLTKTGFHAKAKATATLPRRQPDASAALSRVPTTPPLPIPLIPCAIFHRATLPIISNNSLHLKLYGDSSGTFQIESRAAICASPASYAVF
jgi:hypothetical protein